MYRLGLALLLLSLPLAADAQWVEGTHYELLTVTPELREDGRIEVIEAFWYGCPSCFNFEPHLVRWLQRKPEDVAFVRVAASMAPAWRVHSRAFHTAEALGVLDQMHPRIFHAIHIDRTQLNTVEAFAELFQRHANIDPETFRTTFQGFPVETRMRRGDNIVRRYRVSAVPTIIINGRYSTNPGLTRGFPQLIELMDHLIELERQRAATASNE